MINVAIVGVSGYTGLELVKILINHPKFNINYAAASEEEESICSLHPSLKGVYECKVEKADAKEVSKHSKVVFLALPHKTSMGFAKELIKEGVKVVDLSADYRLKLSTYEKFYCEHLDKEHLKDAVYGLPELYRQKIKDSYLCANPGCYPTASLLSLAPFADLIDEKYPIFIDAKSGVSGAGKKCTPNTHFVNINENIFAYNPLTHRHAPEIAEKLGNRFKINFVPHLIPVSRGMLVNSYFLTKQKIDVLEVLREFYKQEKFVRVWDKPVDIKMSSGTNFCDIYAKSDGNSVFISSSIDNLLRGASSQAVANANLMCGFAEDLGIPNIAYVP